jgi:hypothetical protein
MDRITMKAGWNDPIVSIGGLESTDPLRNGGYSMTPALMAECVLIERLIAASA